MLTPKEAEKELELGAGLMPGPWVQHSKSVAVNARMIAEHTDCMDVNVPIPWGLCTI